MSEEIVVPEGYRVLRGDLHVRVNREYVNGYRNNQTKPLIVVENGQEIFVEDVKFLNPPFFAVSEGKKDSYGCVIGASVHLVTDIALVR
jgi:hypothetical protein